MIEPWLKAIRDHPDRPPAAQCWTLTMLAERLDWSTGQGFASERQLMADADVTGSTVRRATKWAREAGLLKEISRGTGLAMGVLVPPNGRCACQPVSRDLLTTIVNRSAMRSQPVSRIAHHYLYLHQDLLAHHR